MSIKEIIFTICFTVVMLIIFIVASVYAIAAHGMEGNGTGSLDYYEEYMRGDYDK